MPLPVEVSGPTLAVQTCARRLAPLGADLFAHVDATATDTATFRLEGDGDPGVDVRLSWYGPARHQPHRGGEALVQALSGLMQVHGRDAGGPRRIGLEVASVAAGIFAAQAVLAALIGHGRGVPTSRIDSSVLQAALGLLSHRVVADSSGSQWNPVAEGPAPGPPFRSADGWWFEIETLDPSAWKAFWERLGGGALEVGWAWHLFRPRYFRGTCTLPPGFHEALAAHSLAEIEAAAADHHVSLSRVRSYDDVLDDPGWSWGHPLVEPSSSGATANPSGSAPPTGPAPLAGLRVVESTTRLQGPYPTQLLRQLGAHIVRVEPPGGDPFRTVPPLLDEVGSFYRCFNRGKEIVELDLSDHGGRDALRDLVADADVFLHNWRPGKAAEWGLDVADLAAINPHLVYAQASGWGQRPEASRLIGTDFVVQAFAAIGAGIRPDDEPPLPSRALLTDYVGALVTGEALLRGLYARERTGRGQRVEGSLLAGAMALQAHVLDDLVAGREKGRRRGRPVWTPLDHPLATADGSMVVRVDDDDDFQRVCRVCGVDGSLAGRASVERRVAQRISERGTAEWEERLNAAGVSCASVCTDIGRLPHDPSLAELFEPLAASACVPVSPWELRR